MKGGIKVFPLGLDFFIVFQFGVGFAEFDTFFQGYFDYFEYHEQIDAQSAIFFLNAGQVEIQDIIFFKAP